MESELRAELDRERETIKKCNAQIQDLQRQVRELEGIVRRRQTMVSSVLPCSATPTSSRERELQEQVDRLQKQAQERQTAERHTQEQLQLAEQQLQERQAATAQAHLQLTSLKTKYDDLVASLETQLNAAHGEINRLKEKLEQMEAVDSTDGSEANMEQAEQIEEQNESIVDQPAERRFQNKKRPRRSQSVGENAAEKRLGHGMSASTSTLMVMPHQQNRPPQSVKPETESHLIASIRGLQYELNAKEKDIARLNRELSDVKATNRRLQQERQKLLNDQQKSKIGTSAVDHDLEAENRGLRRDVARLQEDLLSLHAKRVSDLNRLQAKHEEDLEQLVCERVNERVSERSSEGRVAELQGQLYTQQLVIAHLKEQMKQMEHNQEEMTLLKKERDYLELSVIEMTKKLSRAQESASPEAVQYAALQDKIDELEARHEVRERRLQAIVRDLLQRQREPSACTGSCDSHHDVRAGTSSTQCPASLRLLHKNRDLCFYRAELDRLLEALTDLERSRKSAP